MANDNNKKKYIKYEDTTYILEDSRLPDPTAEDNGKVLGIVNGAYVLKQEQGGGGEGTVKSVNNIEPDANGNVTLSIPSKTSDLQNDSGFLTQHQSLAAYRTASAQDTIDAAQDTAITAKYAKPEGGIPASDLADDMPFFTLPESGEAGQALLSDGEGGAAWGYAGIPEAVKTALLNCFANVAWANENGQTYYDALESALETDVPVPPTPVPTSKNHLIITANETPVSGYIGDDGSVVANINAAFVDKLMPIKPVAFLNGTSSAVSFSVPGNNNVYRFAFYDANGSFLSRTYINGTTSEQYSEPSVIPPAPTGAAYMKIGWSGNSVNPNPNYVLISDFLADSEYPVLGYVDSSGNIATEGAIVYTTDFIAVPSGYSKFALTPYDVISGGVISRIVFYDSSKTLISRHFYRSSGSGGEFIGNIPSNAAYYRMTKPDGKQGIDMLVVEG